LFDKENFKYFLIWPASVLISISFRYYGFKNPDVLIINNYLVFSLVFGPALVVTIILVINKILKSKIN